MFNNMTEQAYIKLGARTEAKDLIERISCEFNTLYETHDLPSTQQVTDLRSDIDLLLEAIEIYNKS